MGVSGALIASTRLEEVGTRLQFTAGGLLGQPSPPANSMPTASPQTAVLLEPPTSYARYVQARTTEDDAPSALPVSGQHYYFQQLG